MGLGEAFVISCRVLVLVLWSCQSNSMCPTNQSLSDPRPTYASMYVCTQKGTTVGVVDEGGGRRRQTYKSGQLSLLNDFNCFPANCNRSRRSECLSPTMYRLQSVWWTTIERRYVLALYLLILVEILQCGE